jgi:acyl carrier protein
MAVFDQLTEVIRKILERPELTLTPQTTAPEVPSWDSVNHVRIITAVERAFSVKFTIAEIVSFENVGDLAAAIESKRTERP